MNRDRSFRVEIRQNSASRLTVSHARVKMQGAKVGRNALYTFLNKRRAHAGTWVVSACASTKLSTYGFPAHPGPPLRRNLTAAGSARMLRRKQRTHCAPL